MKLLRFDHYYETKILKQKWNQLNHSPEFFTKSLNILLLY